MTQRNEIHKGEPCGFVEVWRGRRTGVIRADGPAPWCILDKVIKISANLHGETIAVFKIYPKQ